MRKKNRKGGTGEKPVLSIRELNADVMLLTETQFRRRYNCSREEYMIYLEQAGIENSQRFLFHVIDGIKTGSIEVRGAIAREVVTLYERRLISLDILNYEKVSGAIVSPVFGEC